MEWAGDHSEASDANHGGPECPLPRMFELRGSRSQCLISADSLATARSRGGNAETKSAIKSERVMAVSPAQKNPPQWAGSIGGAVRSESRARRSQRSQVSHNSRPNASDVLYSFSSASFADPPSSRGQSAKTDKTQT